MCIVFFLDIVKIELVLKFLVVILVYLVYIKVRVLWRYIVVE